MLTRPNEYRAVARIKVHREVQFSGANDPVFSDPYFIPTEFEVIQSELVLGKVLEKLNLVSEWGKTRAAGLKPVEAISLLKRQMNLRPVRNTELIEIRVTSSAPDEAAKLANAVAETFRDFRLDQNRLLQTQQQKAGSRLITYCIQIVDSAVAPARPIHPNRPLAGVVGIFGSMLMILGIYLITQSRTD